MPDRTIFRHSAIAAYKRGMEKDVVPRLISWPIIACLWLLLGVFIAAGFFAWDIRIPTYVDGSGMILAQGTLAPGDGLQADGQESLAVVFLPPDQAGIVRVGMPAGVQVGSAGMLVRSTVVKVEPGVVSPDVARRRYQLDGAGGFLIMQPSVVVIIRLNTPLPDTAYAGTTVSAKVETGTQRLLALFPGLGQFLRGDS